MNSCGKKMATGRVCRFAKPRARPLRAEVPCNYIHGRLAAALQSVFEICSRSLTPFFFKGNHIRLLIL